MAVFFAAGKLRQEGPGFPVPGILWLLEHGGGRAEDRAKLTGGEGLEGAEAGLEFGGGYAALAVQGAQKIFGAAFSFLRIALGTAGNEIAVRIGPAAGLRDDMVEDSPTNEKPPQTIEAPAALAHVNGLAPAQPLKEIHLLDVGAAVPPAKAGSQGRLLHRGVDLVRQENFDQMARLGAVNQAQGALGSEAAHGVASDGLRKAKATAEPDNSKAEFALAFEAALPHEIGIDDALGKIEAQARNEILFELLPEECSIWFVVFHSWDPEERVGSPQLKVHFKKRRGINGAQRADS